VIPRPRELRTTGETLELDGATRVVADPELAAVASFLPWPSADEGTVRLRHASDEELGAEGYRLTVGAAGIELAAGTPAGAFYGVQTLLQLVDGSTVAGVQIVDRPRFRWRGQHVDVARHFLPVAWLKRLVDLLALHKLNVLHLHLTDDQGWRMPIDKYPRLTEVGAWRRESMAGYYDENRFDGIPHGGHYTKAELRDLVAYAAERFVTIVPEIDMPGHMQAAVAAYPELGNGEEVEVWTRWGVSTHILNADESTLQFAKDVLDEVLEIFPSAYVHVGGDECPKDEWRASERVQELMRERGLATEEELQSWFMTRIGEHLTERGRVMVGWDEILEGGLAPGAVVMSWRGEEGGIEAARADHDVVIGPEQFVYFDWYQAPSDSGEPVAIHPGRVTDVAKVYGFDPVPAALDEQERAHVLGSQGHLWTEYVPTTEHAEYMLFPRLCALAEVVWSPRERDFTDFEGRLRQHLGRLDALGVHYRPLGSLDAVRPPV
jgi:hexosaminidase